MKRVQSELSGHNRKDAGREVGCGVHAFDQVFDSQASTRQVYKGAAQRIVLSALDGINGAILAYGQVLPPASQICWIPCCFHICTYCVC